MPESQDRVQGGGVPQESCIITRACQKRRYAGQPAVWTNGVPRWWSCDEARCWRLRALGTDRECRDISEGALDRRQLCADARFEGGVR